jgi:tRNA(Ile)-lysidine synthase
MIRRLIPDAGFIEVEAARHTRPIGEDTTEPLNETASAITAMRLNTSSCTCDPATFKARDQVGHLDADLVQLPLAIGTRRPGDRMRPLGLDVPKRLQDILVDARVPRHLRDSLPVISDREEIVWIPGVTIAERKRVTAATRRQLHLEIVRG